MVNSKIGGMMVKGISASERKRTSIGVELITDPNLIYLDEPTTGMDSFTATTIVNVLHDLASTGRTVVCTIHQPNSTIFKSFDQLMLLAAGRIIYQNSAKISVKFFKSIGYPCPRHTNPADHFMNMMSIEAYDEIDHHDQEEVERHRSMLEEEHINKILYLQERYENSELKIDPDDLHPDKIVKHMCSHLHPDATGFDELNEVKYSAPFMKQYYLLLLRSIKNIIRLPLASYVRAAVFVVISIMIILIYGQLNTDAKSIQNRNGVLYMILASIIMNSLQSVVLIFPEERPVFLREQGENLYSITGYYFAKISSDIPMIIVNINIISLVYFICKLNLNDASHFFIFYGYSYLLMWTITGLGFFIGALVTDTITGLAISVLMFVAFMLVSGFFVSQNNMVLIMYPIKYISPYKWAFQTYLLNEYSDLSLSCSPACNPLQSLGFEETLGESIWATAILGVSYYIMTYIALHIVCRLTKG